MNPPTVDDLLRFASTLEGETLTTAGGRATFSLRALPAGVEITPQSGKPRRVSRERIQRVVDEYAQLRSTRPGDYQDSTFDASYLLAIIDRYSGQ